MSPPHSGRNAKGTSSGGSRSADWRPQSQRLIAMIVWRACDGPTLRFHRFTVVTRKTEVSLGEGPNSNWNRNKCVSRQSNEITSKTMMNKRSRRFGRLVS